MKISLHSMIKSTKGINPHGNHNTCNNTIIIISLFISNSSYQKHGMHEPMWHFSNTKPRHLTVELISNKPLVVFYAIKFKQPHWMQEPMWKLYNQNTWYSDMVCHDIVSNCIIYELWNMCIQLSFIKKENLPIYHIK